MKRPAFQFYPADWRKDSALQSCSGTARGLWIEMMCVMHECEPYGHLSINGNALTEPQAARMVGFGVSEYRRALIELDGAGVFSRSASGVIYCRRMVKDEGIRNIRADAGKLGGNPALLKQKDNQKDKQSVKQTSTPSSSASSSLTPARKRAVPLPPGFGISRGVLEWAQDKGHGYLTEHLEAFVGRAKAKRYTYVDWDQALMNAIREDWAGIRKAKSTPPGSTQADKRAKVAAAIWGAHGTIPAIDDAIDGTAERVA